MTDYSQPTPEEIRAKIEDIFARPEFSPEQGKGLLQFVLEALAEFFAWLGELSEAAPVLFWVLLIGCLVLLALVLVHITWTVRRTLFAGGRRAGADKDRRRRERLSHSYLEEAGRRASEGEFTEAIRFLFLSLVYRFDETGRVNFQKAYTNREYLGLLADNAELRTKLQVFVDTLDDHWYGQRPTPQCQYQTCRTLYGKLT